MSLSCAACPTQHPTKPVAAVGAQSLSLCSCQKLQGLTGYLSVHSLAEQLLWRMLVSSADLYCLYCCRCWSFQAITSGTSRWGVSAAAAFSGQLRALCIFMVPALADGLDCQV